DAPGPSRDAATRRRPASDRVWADHQIYKTRLCSSRIRSDFGRFVVIAFSNINVAVSHNCIARFSGARILSFKTAFDQLFDNGPVHRGRFRLYLAYDAQRSSYENTGRNGFSRRLATTAELRRHRDR